MSQLDELITDLRYVDLAQPDANSPSPSQIYTKVRDLGQWMLNQANLSNVPWSVNVWPFSFSAGQKERGIGATDYGGMGGTVWTASPSDPDFLPQQVLTIPHENMADYASDSYIPAATTGRGWQPGTPGFGSRPDKGRWPGGVMSIYRKNGAPMIRLMPPLALNEQNQPQYFELWYEIGSFAPENLHASAVIPQWHPCLRALAAKSLLPLCKWSDLDKEETATLYEKLTIANENELALYLPQFQAYIDRVTNPGGAESVGFADWYLRDCF